MSEEEGWGDEKTWAMTNRHAPSSDPKPFGDRSAAHGIEYIKATLSLRLVTGGGKTPPPPHNSDKIRIRSGMKIRVDFSPSQHARFDAPRSLGHGKGVLTSVAGEEATSTFPENPPEQQSMLLRSTAGKNCSFVSLFCLIWTHGSAR